MVEESIQNVVLMSIQPRFVQSIFDGEKKVEFRKTRFAMDVSHVVIYATLPIGKIVGYFEVKAISIASPKELWKQYKEISGVQPNFFYNYYENSTWGVAIEIGKVYELKNFLLPSLLTSVIPQSYLYIDSREFEKIVQGAREKLIVTRK